MLRRAVQLLGKDAYKVLGVEKNATDADIKKAYKKKAAQLHPDVSSRPNASEEFAELQGAYETLKDPRKRAFYNSTGSKPSSDEDLKGFDEFRRMQQAQEAAARQRAQQQQHQHQHPFEGGFDPHDPYGFAQGGPGGGRGRAFRRWEQNPWEDLHDTFYHATGAGPEWGQPEFGGHHGMPREYTHHFEHDEDEVPPWMGGGRVRQGQRQHQQQQQQQQQRRRRDEEPAEAEPEKERPDDLHATAVVEVTFDEMLRGGGAKTISYEARKSCWTCHGSGVQGGKKPQHKSCSQCHGRGYVVVQITPGEVAGLECDACDGTGSATVPPPECPRCAGAGVVVTSTAVTVGLPAGLESGSVVRIVGEGHASKKDKNRRGDLLLHVHVQGQSKKYTRDKDGQLHTYVPVPLATALLGGTVTVHDLRDQPVEIQIPPHTLPFAQIELPYPGLPRYPAGKELVMKLDAPPEAPPGGVGKVFGHVVLTYPSGQAALTEAQKEALLGLEPLAAEHPQSKYIINGAMDYIRAKHRAPESNKRPQPERAEKEQVRDKKEKKEKKEKKDQQRHNNKHQKQRGGQHGHQGKKHGRRGGGGHGPRRGDHAHWDVPYEFYA